MKITELLEHGRIVKNVNTTVDVDVDEIPKQAEKFGNKVDKDGRPPSMSNSVRGKSTNVLFNLGMTETKSSQYTASELAIIEGGHSLEDVKKSPKKPGKIFEALNEGILVKLERGDDQDILHFKNSKEKSRVEVRGKQGYEAGGYDPDDPLHQTLDKLGKAANISDLMNGEIVSINPNHPHGKQALATAQQVMSEDDQEQITPQILQKLEYYIDKLFSSLGIDVEFTKHFLDRVNDPRNQRQITKQELARLFKETFRKWGKRISKMGPNAEAVIKDMQTDINLPFVLNWDQKNKELDLVAKTVMRKKNFSSPDQQLPIESITAEKAPPGREKQVKKLKGKFDDPSAPYAIAWAQHNKKRKSKNND